jgi:hypothetical protein
VKATWGVWTVQVVAVLHCCVNADWVEMEFLYSIQHWRCCFVYYSFQWRILSWRRSASPTLVSYVILSYWCI